MPGERGIRFAGSPGTRPSRAGRRRRPRERSHPGPRRAGRGRAAPAHLAAPV